MTTPQFCTSRRSRRAVSGLTMIEILIVITIIAILMGMSFVGFSKAIAIAQRSKSINNVKSLVNACIHWSTDHGGKLPSPQYPGDYKGDAYPVAGDKPSNSKPKYWDLDESGLWLDGVVFARVYIEADSDEEGEESEESESNRLESYAPGSAGASRATKGAHLVGSAFESPSSVANNPQETDWYRHCFAMNANLQFDALFSSSEDDKGGAWLTEKTLGNIEYQPEALLFIDCNEKSVVMASDIELIRQSSDRYGGGSVVAGFVGGNIEIIKTTEIPEGDIYTDPDASRFWRGVRED